MVNRLALAEARLVTAKLLWHFDIELDGDHSTWVEDARFYVSFISLYSNMQLCFNQYAPAPLYLESGVLTLLRSSGNSNHSMSD